MTVPLETTLVHVDPTGAEIALRTGIDLLAGQLDPLQAARCDNITETYMNATCQGDFIGVGTGIFFDSMGPAFPLMLALIFLPSSYMLTGHLAIPLTLILFIGSMIAQFLPPPFPFLAVVVAAIGVGTSLFLAIHKLRSQS